MFNLFRPAASRRTIERLYGGIVAQSRHPYFYAVLSVPDTPEGRFEMLVLHTVLVCHRLKGGSEAERAMSQDVFDAFLADMDAAMREMGVGDLTVPKRMKKIGVQPSFLMNHLRLYGAAFRDDIFGPERANNPDPAGWCVKTGVPFSLHTDSPCSPLGSLALVESAVTRRCIVDNSILGKDQAVTVDQALKAVTIDAAKQCGMGDRIGSLEKGKEADFVILEDNPYKVDPDTISKIKISETWVGGQKKFG